MLSIIISKLKKQLYIIGLLLCVFSILCAVLESVKYPGFIVKHFSIAPIWIYAITGLFIKSYPPPNPDKFFFSKLFRVLSIISITFSGFLLILEMIYYPNYVFSTFHINLEGLQLLTILFFIYFVLTNLLHSDLFSIVRTTLFISSITLLINYGFANIISTTALIKKEYALMKIGGENDYEKQVSGWGDIFIYSQILKKQTPSNSVIALPPAQNHWLYSGNIVLMRYFLYPRELVNIKESDSESNLYIIPDQQFDYIAIIWGESNHRDKSQYGWPKVIINSEYIEYYDLTMGKIIKVDTDTYDPYSELNSLYKWGIVKIQK